MVRNHGGEHCQVVGRSSSVAAHDLEEPSSQSTDDLGLDETEEVVLDESSVGEVDVVDIDVDIGSGNFVGAEGEVDDGRSFAGVAPTERGQIQHSQAHLD